jgi:tetratricopeptide (TPR) repeat protein
MRQFHRALAGAIVVTGLIWAQQAPVAKEHTNSDAAIEKLSKQGDAYRQENKIDDAIALYKKGVALKPSWDEGWWYLGTLYYDLDQYSEGRDAFKHLALIKPQVAAGWAMLGLCEFQTRDYTNSLKHLGHGIALGVDAEQNISDVVHYHFAMLLTRNGDFEQAMKTLGLFAQRNLNQPDYIEAMGIAALRKPLLPSELPPSEREMVLDVGRAMYDAAGLRTPVAAAEFKTAVDKYSTQPNIHYLYGSFLLFSDVDAGMAELKKEIELSPVHVPALVTLASEYLKVQDYKTGLPFAERAVDANPSSFPAHAVLGRILFEGAIDPTRGVKELERARTLEPASPQVHAALATAYAKVGRKEDAAKERQEFLKDRKAADEANKSNP